MGGQPNFGPLAQIISNGMDYHYSRTITDEERTLERTGLLARSNHNLDRLLKKEVDHGFANPVPIDVVAKIKNSSVQPPGLAKQLGLSSDGTRKSSTE